MNLVIAPRTVERSIDSITHCLGLINIMCVDEVCGQSGNKDSFIFLNNFSQTPPCSTARCGCPDLFLHVESNAVNRGALK